MAETIVNTNVFLFCLLFVSCFSLRQKLITEAVVTPRNSSLRRRRPRQSCRSLEGPMGASQVLFAPPLLSHLTAAPISSQVDVNNTDPVHFDYGLNILKMF